MVQCQNCGQINNTESNFCRFCGTKITSPPGGARPGAHRYPPPQHNQYQPQQQQQPNYEYNPPRPYAWKTDEFQTPDGAKRPAPTSQARPLTNTQMVPNLYAQPQMAVYGYRCPNCGTQNLPLISKKISSAGWIVFAVLLLLFFPLFWVGFLIKEDVKMCGVCGARVG
jgi:RNA polymerase subunit RPABC4/transcription elongation factor Spt4